MLVSVALPLPLAPLTYSVPDELAHRVTTGSRVVVPVGTRRELGFIVGKAEAAAGMKLRAILSAPDDAPTIDAPLLATCRWIAEYYAAPLGVVLRSALPGALTGASKPVPSHKTEQHVEIKKELTSLVERDKVFGRAFRQREVY